jgi:Protein of unknown function (DUF1579)
MHQLGTLLLGLTLGATGTLALLQAPSGSNAQEPKVEARPKQERPAAGQEAPPGIDMEMMMRQMQLAAPGEQHEKLMRDAGNWQMAYSMRMAPEAPWTEASGDMKSTAVLGGRWLLQEINMTVMDMPMQGLQLLGYDNLKEEYVSLWFDTFATWPVTCRGKQQPDGSINFQGTMVDVAGERPFRMLTKVNEQGQVQTVMYDTIPPVGEIEVMKITATKRQ